MAELRRLAEHCDFGAGLLDALRDRLVCGLDNESTQKRQLTKRDLTLDMAYDIAVSMETVAKDAIQLQTKNMGECSVNKFLLLLHVICHTVLFKSFHISRPIFYSTVNTIHPSNIHFHLFRFSSLTVKLLSGHFFRRILHSVSINAAAMRVGKQRDSDGHQRHIRPVLWSIAPRGYNTILVANCYVLTSLIQRNKDV